MAKEKKDAGKKLTAKQEVFCQEYLIDLNATQAAIRAGYSEKTAYSIGEENLRKPEIQQRVTELQRERSQRTGITADMVIKELAAIGFSNATDFVKVETQVVEMEGLPKEDGSPGELVKREYRSVAIMETDSIAQEKIPAIASIKQGANGIEIKLHDKVKSLELLGKHLGMFVDKVEHSGDVGVHWNETKTYDSK